MEIVSPWDELRARLEAELGEAVTVDGLTGAWRIAQRAAGHRHSIDDVLTAHYALRHGGRPSRALDPTASPSGDASGRAYAALDLGTGIGTVGLLVLSALPADATLVAVEAQAISYRLLLANLEGNGIAARVDARHGDLRDLALSETFPLITGSPPYFPVGTGVMPADAQKAHARFELRGDVTDYCKAAARHLAPDGVFAFCFPTVQRERAEAAVAAAGLVVATSQDVIPRADRAPLFSLFACGANCAPRGAEDPFVVRDAAGRMTEAMLTVRRGFGHFSVERDPEAV